MKTKILGPYKSPQVQNMLKSRGIEDVENFLSPVDAYIQDSIFLDNIDKGAKLLLDTIAADGKILLVVDCDVDGYTSSAIMWQYIYEGYDKKVDYILHKEKQHGLEDHIDDLLEKEPYDLIILPDSSTEDKKYHDLLGERGTKCLILDHHPSDTMDFSEHAVIINNQISQEYKNKALTGAGVTWQFCRYLDNVTGNLLAPLFTDLAAVGIIADMGVVTEIENMAIINHIIHKEINNYFLKTLIEKQSFVMKNQITPITVGFYITPLINAMIRVGTMEEKERLFLAFIDGERLVTSNKRGAKGSLEKVAIESARECGNARNRQNKVRDKAVESIEMKIYKNELLDHKVLVVPLEDEDEFPKELNGLVAMILSKKFNMPTMLGRINSDGEFKGSIRGLENSPLEDFKASLLETEKFNYVKGHPNAAGFSIQESKLDSMITEFDNALSEVNFGQKIYPVDFVFDYDSDEIGQIAEELTMVSHTWGQGNPEPYVLVQNIPLTKDSIRVVGKKSNVIQFSTESCKFVMFNAEETIDMFSRIDGTFYLEVVGRLSISDYDYSPQVIIQDFNWSKEASLTF